VTKSALAPRRWGLLGAGLLLMAACQPAAPTLVPTLAPVLVASATADVAAATVTPTVAAPTVTPISLPTATAIPEPLPPPDYELRARVDLAARIVAVTASIRVHPPDHERLVFNFNPSHLGLLATPLEAAVDGASVTPSLEGAWVSVPLAGVPLADGGTGAPVTVSFAYSLALPPIHPGAWGWRGTLGWTERQVNLGDWYPVLAVHDPAAGWVTPAPSPLGEYVSAPAGDYTVIVEAAGARGPVLVAGSGGPAPCGEAWWCARLTGARFVAYVVSESMLAQSVTTTTGVTVTSVYLPEHAAAGEAALRTAAAALEVYSDLFGDYPFDSFAQIEGDFYDGMEYSGASFVGSGYYAEYDGTPNNLLTIISAHEVAHQWWHTLVGNDQAAEPWLDEALCTYSELLFLEARHPASTAWWWAFRVDWFAPQGPVDSTIYDYGDFRGYVDAVYLRGAQMLHAMRAEVGEEAFLGFLRAYADDRAGQVATGADFWAAYAAAGGAADDIRAAYLRGP
jgi:hypothetical protein